MELIIWGWIQDFWLVSLICDTTGGILWPPKVDYSAITPEEINMDIWSTRLAVVFNVAIGIGIVTTIVIVGDYYSFWTY